MNNLNLYQNILWKSVARGIMAFLALLTIYFLILTLVSGWRFAQEQFAQFWFYVISLALGFGIQVGLYSYLKSIVREQVLAGRVLVTTGATSTTAMISCCAHYLTNILPILGVTGIITFITQYQIQFFWFGLFFNFLGIVYTGSKIIKFSRQQL